MTAAFVSLTVPMMRPVVWVWASALIIVKRKKEDVNRDDS
jgi:hypothetical protein